jgi:hypothetical protein
LNIFQEPGVKINDQLDIDLQSLIRQWNKSFDVLFSIHPDDGSLLTWTLEFLDAPWRQPILSFASRLPAAFSLSDAASLKPLFLHTFFCSNLPLREETQVHIDLNTPNGILQVSSGNFTNLSLKFQY